MLASKLLLLLKAMVQLLFDESISCYLIRKINHTGKEVEHVPHLVPHGGYS